MMKHTYHLGDLIVTTYHELKKATEDSLRKYGLGMGQLNLLMVLYRCPDQSLNQQDFVKALKIDKANVSRNLNKLLVKDYLELTADYPKAYKLTEKGRSIKEEIMASFMTLYGRMSHGASAEELSQVAKTLEIILLNLQNHNKGENL